MARPTTNRVTLLALLGLLLVSMLPLPHAAAAEVEASGAAKLRVKALLLSFSIRGMLHALGVANVSDAAEIQAKLGVNASIASELAAAATLDMETLLSMNTEQLEETVSRLEALHYMLGSMLGERSSEALGELRLRHLAKLYTRLAEIAEKAAKSLNDTRLEELAAELREAVKKGDFQEAARIAAEIRAELQLARLEAALRVLNNATVEAAINPAVTARLKHSMELLEKLLQRLEAPGANESIVVERLTRIAALLDELNTTIDVAGEAAAAGNATAALEAMLTLLQNKLDEVAAKLPPTAAKKLEKINETLQEAAEALAKGDLQEAARLLAKAHHMITTLELQATVDMVKELRLRHAMPPVHAGGSLAELVKKIHRLYKEKTLEKIMDKLEELEDKVAGLIEENKELLNELQGSVSNPAAVRLLARAALLNSQAELHYKAALEAKASGNMTRYAAELRVAFTLAVKANALARAAAAASGYGGIVDRMKHHAKHGMEKIKNETVKNLPWIGGEENKTEANATLVAAINETIASIAARLALLKQIAANMSSAGVREARACEETIEKLEDRINSIVKAVTEGKLGNDVIAEINMLNDTVARLEYRLAARLAIMAKTEAQKATMLKVVLAAQLNTSTGTEQAGSLIASAEAKISQSTVLLEEYEKTHDPQYLAEAAQLLLEARQELRQAAQLLGLAGKDAREAAEKSIERLNETIEKLREELGSIQEAIEKLMNTTSNCTAYLEQALENVSEASVQLEAAANMTAKAQASLDEGNIDAALNLTVEARASVHAAKSLLKHVRHSVARTIYCIEKQVAMEAQRLQENITRLEARIAELRAVYAGNETAQALLDEAEEALQQARGNITAALALLDSLHRGHNVSIEAKAEIVVEAYAHIEAAGLNVDIAASIVVSLEAGAAGPGGGHGGGGGVPSPPGTPGHG